MQNTTGTQSSDTASTEIKDRIRKLLNMAAANSGATEAEAATAFGMAQKLLTRYNLDQAALEADGKVIAEPINHIDIVITNEDWRRNMWRAAADANFCRVVSLQNSGRAFYETWVPSIIHLVGKPTNRAAVIEMMDWLLAQIEGVPTGEKDRRGNPKMAGGLYRESFKLKPYSNDPKSWKDWRYGFFNGISERLVERMREMTVAQTINVPGAMALMRTSELAVKAYKDPNWNYTANRAQGTHADGGAHLAGYDAGNRVTLGKNGLSGGAARLGSGR